MKTNLFMLFSCFVLCVGSIGARAQAFDYATELSKLATIPNSPEAEAFMKYGDTETNLHTGTPNVAIPLYTIQGREMDLPLTLTYDGTPIKVGQLATWSGLGWNLNAGGRISRMVNGLPDDYIVGNYNTLRDHSIRTQMAGYIASPFSFPTQQAVIDYFEFLRDLSQNLIDAQPDYFMINAPGISGTIVFDQGTSETAKVLDNPRIKVEAFEGTTTLSASHNSITKWKVTGEDGTVYYFEEQETTIKHGDDSTPVGGILNEYVSSWLLTKMESPNEKDVYDFTYTDLGYWTEEQLGHTATHVENAISSSTSYPNPDSESLFLPTYQVKQKFLGSVAHNQQTMVTTTLGNRDDIDIASALEYLQFFDRDSVLLKAVDFHYGYFNLDGQLPSQRPADAIRLKLDSLQVKGGDAQNYQTYAFEYIDPDGLPERSSKAMDYLGYYNGTSGNILYPEVVDDGRTYSGKDRTPNFTYAQKGLLKKITYPTGGHTQFSYEANTISTTQSNTYTVVDYDVFVNSGTVINDALYRDDNGNLCDDEYLDASYPKIKIGDFQVTEQQVYDLKFTAFPGESQLYIMDAPSQSALQGFDNFCDFYNYGNINLFLVDTNSFDTTMTLNPGWYRVLILMDENSDQGNSYGTVRFTVSHEQTTNFNTNTSVVGGRIAEIREYTDATTLTLTKAYDYKDALGASSGIVHYSPDLHYKTFSEFSDGSVTSKMHRMATLPAVGSQPFISYGTVTEKRVDGSGTAQGSTRYHFYNGKKGATPSESPPYENNRYASLEAGEIEKRQVYHQNGDSLLVETFTYGGASTFSVQGIVSIYDEDKNDKKLMLKDNGDGTYGYAYHPFPVDCPTSLLCSQGTLCSNPTNFDSSYISCISDSYRALNFRYHYASGLVGGPLVKVTREYLDESDGTQNELVKTEQNIYDAAVDHLLKEQRVTTSDGKLLTTEYIYPKQNIVSGSGALTLDGQHSKVLGIKQYEDNTLLDEQQTAHASHGNAILPTSIQTAKAGQTLETRMQMDYHSSGNLKEAYPVTGFTGTPGVPIKGPITSYFWGYDNLYVIAVIKNASYSNIATALGVSETVLNDYDETDMVALNSLRGLLPNAQVTTYTYDPQVGVKRITDPSGNYVEHDYDAFNRLEKVTDRNGKLLTDYKYHYKYQN
ncbi:RHS repeat domain-containing protein [Allomuricauda sp. SCSIO 65647]|uniref:RHS repeat domain-containing protein n=1 Tax=Allomuricauda sp. SCSIO 65647 TaxID=2908843 RepID=UPI001F334439|nr:RHS repeat domain-containing protein [Muricauda sp. SCSIO 65647]UJH66378.1 RHS repeat protein [Muricauda sp. SCSIO 65647]